MIIRSLVCLYAKRPLPKLVRWSEQHFLGSSNFPWEVIFRLWLKNSLIYPTLKHRSKSSHNDAKLALYKESMSASILHGKELNEEKKYCYLWIWSNPIWRNWGRIDNIKNSYRYLYRYTIVRIYYRMIYKWYGCCYRECYICDHGCAKIRSRSRSFSHMLWCHHEILFLI